jgi:hypothetical protein
MRALASDGREEPSPKIRSLCILGFPFTDHLDEARMRRLAVAALAAASVAACRSYDSYGPLTDQSGLIPAEQFARFGRQQAEIVAIGRALAEWRMNEDEAAESEQTSRAGCFARRFADVATVDPDPQGHRLTVRFANQWRVAVLPIPGATAPEAVRGIDPPGPSPCP